MSRLAGSLLKLGFAGVVAAVLFAAAFFSGWDVRGSIDEWSQEDWGARISARIASWTATEHPVVSVEPSSDVLPDDAPRELPPADDRGVILLSGDGPYVWNRPLRSPTPIVLRGSGESRPVVELSAGAGVAAPGVLLENLELRSQSPSILAVRTNRLAIRNVRFARPAADGRNAVDWGAETDARPAELQLQNVVFNDVGNGVRCRTAPAAVQANNVLHLGSGALLEFAALPIPGREIAVRLERVTQRQAGALLQFVLPESNRPLGRVNVAAKDCVFHFAGNGSGLCRFRLAFPGRFPRRLVQYSGEGSLIPPGTPIAVDAAGATGETTSEDAVQIDGGLIAGPFDFAGEYSANPADSVVQRHSGPRRSSQPPGFAAGDLR